MSKTHLKIGLVLDDSLDTTDGVQQYIITLGNWLSGKGCDVHYLVGQTSRTDIPNVHSLARNWRVRFNGNRLSVPLPANKRRIRQLLIAQQFDILHVQTPYSPFMAGRLIRLASSQTAIVGTFHILPYDSFTRWVNKLLAVLNYRTAKRLKVMIANSTPSKQFADEVYGFQSVIIPNPFSLSTFTVPPIASSLPTIVFLGRLVARKGARQLLEAIWYMDEHKLFSGSYRVILGGKGPLLDELQAFVVAKKLADRVSFPGFIAEAEKAQFLSQADVAVFPSVSGESFGISLLEAMAAAQGVVLGGDNPGYRSVLAPLAEEQIVTPNDTAAFARQLARWLNDSSARSAAAKAQKQYVKQFDIHTVGAKIVEVYNEALHAPQNVR